MVNSACLFVMPRAYHDDKMAWGFWQAFPFIDPLCGNLPVPEDSLHKGSVMRSFAVLFGVSIINGLANSRVAGDLRRLDTHVASL